MVIRPLDDRVVVQPKEAAAVSAGGLHIPDQARDRPQQGTVLAVGPDVKELKVQDTVLYGRYAGSVVSVGDQELLVMRQADVLAVVEDETFIGKADRLAG